MVLWSKELYVEGATASSESDIIPDLGLTFAPLSHLPSFLTSFL